MDTDDHDGVGEFYAVVFVAVAFEIVAENEDVGAAVCVCLEAIAAEEACNATFEDSVDDARGKDAEIDYDADNSEPEDEQNSGDDATREAAFFLWLLVFFVATGGFFRGAWVWVELRGGWFDLEFICATDFIVEREARC